MIHYLACICADWCDTCTAFKPVFTQLAGERPQLRCEWHVLEELEARFPAIEVETFPTLVLTDSTGQLLFAGPVLPNIDAARQIVDAGLRGALTIGKETAPFWPPVAAELARP